MKKELVVNIADINRNNGTQKETRAQTHAQQQQKQQPSPSHPLTLQKTGDPS